MLEPLDLLYDTGDDFDTVYAAIAARVVEAAQEHGEVVYAVPGSPSVAERTVVLLRGAGIDIEIVPGLSFADLAWNRLGIDPMTGAAGRGRAARSPSIRPDSRARCCSRSATRGSCSPT